MLYTTKIHFLKGIIMDKKKVMFYAKSAVVIQSVIIGVLLIAIIGKAIYDWLL